MGRGGDFQRMDSFPKWPPGQGMATPNSEPETPLEHTGRSHSVLHVQAHEQRTGLEAGQPGLSAAHMGYHGC